MRQKVAGMGKVLVRESSRKEWGSTMSTKTVKVLSKDEQDHVRLHHPGQVIESRFVEVKKKLEKEVEGESQEGGTAVTKRADWQAKSRWVVRGYQWEGAEQLERTSPVASTRTLYNVLNLAASYEWRLVIADVSTAFLNSPIEDEGSQ